MRTRRRGLSSIAADTAATSAPAPIEAYRNPYPLGPTFRTLAAMTGRITLKFMPNVETNPITPMASSTTGVCQT